MSTLLEKIAHVILGEMALLSGQSMAAQAGRSDMPVPTEIVERANGAADRVFALLAERGATTREPDGHSRRDDLTVFVGDWPVALMAGQEYPAILKSRIQANGWNVIYELHLPPGEAPQGATGTAQTATHAATQQPLSDGSGPRLVGLLKRCRDFVCYRSCPHHGKWHVDLCLLLKGAIEVQPAVAEGSPQPAEPRPEPRLCRKCGESKWMWIAGDQNDFGCSICLKTDTASAPVPAEGGDTLTPETPLETAQPDVFENAPTSDLVKGLRWIDDRYAEMSGPTSRFAAAAANRLEAQAARIAALEEAARNVRDLMRISELYNSVKGYGDLLKLDAYGEPEKRTSVGTRLRAIGENIDKNQQEAVDLLSAALVGEGAP